ncbi:MAG TPA: YdeI/OmpD-associated family protein [Pyrinomonadaceae bacterium]|nr:YdeI/OmpD-associated family protein [Pyrinomonadaceae bacterium]
MSATKAKRFRVLLEQYAGTQATAIRIPFDVQKTFGTRARVPVRGTINGFAFRSSIFPAGDGTHYMVVNKEVRAGAGVKGGETITVTMERDDEPRVVTPPADLARALKANRAAQAAWDKLSYTHRREHARAVSEAKRPETRQRRIEKAIAALTENKKP